MDSEVSALKAHIDAIVPTLATKADIEVLRAEMHKMSAEGYRWMVASMVGMFIGFGGLYFAANRSFESRPAASSPASSGYPATGCDLSSAAAFTTTVREIKKAPKGFF